mmetsp:Transcript_34680/g.62950  ORF Transcript_34680/g.62950 Transcript_34680/m.62950 type:complete len:210 (+) Transcript_34680:1312-1941(+)
MFLRTTDSPCLSPAPRSRANACSLSLRHSVGCVSMWQTASISRRAASAIWLPLACAFSRPSLAMAMALVASPLRHMAATTRARSLHSISKLVLSCWERSKTFFEVSTASLKQPFCCCHVLMDRRTLHSWCFRLSSLKIEMDFLALAMPSFKEASWYQNALAILCRAKASWTLLPICVARYSASLANFSAFAASWWDPPRSQMQMCTLAM